MARGTLVLRPAFARLRRLLGAAARQLGLAKARPRFAGSLEGVRDGAIYGWARDGARPGGRTDVILETDTGRRLAVTADLLRGDVRAAGFGDGYHGFRVSLARLGPGVGRVTARAAASERALPGSPLSISGGAGRGESERGAIERATGERGVAEEGAAGSTVQATDPAGPGTPQRSADRVTSGLGASAVALSGVGTSGGRPLDLGRWQGLLDPPRPGLVSGWLVDTEEPGRRPMVELRGPDGHLIARDRACRHRPDAPPSTGDRLVGFEMGAGSNGAHARDFAASAIAVASQPTSADGNATRS